ncbi:hypothetical protein COLO4_03375 [Corchorus olitorius]|uniref:Uncharacterized protein n=1 Tax=Corchorus olitorius TaxID=93759 RepID=A0A1R3KYV1_9ROSI|nr:hypothetical protein COLO4_03375 [Corchorus olitorius]
MNPKAASYYSPYASISTTTAPNKSPPKSYSSSANPYTTDSTKSPSC